MINRAFRGHREIPGAEFGGDEFVELQQGGALAVGDIKNLAGRLFVLRHGSQDVCLHDVFDVAEIAGDVSAAIDETGLIFSKTGDPFRNDRRIAAPGILARAEDVEITEADRAESVIPQGDAGRKFH